MGELYPNHALESDDKEESEYASPMIISLVASCCYNLEIITIIIPSSTYVRPLPSSHQSHRI